MTGHMVSCTNRNPRACQARSARDQGCSACGTARSSRDCISNHSVICVFFGSAMRKKHARFDLTKSFKPGKPSLDRGEDRLGTSPPPDGPAYWCGLPPWLIELIQSFVSEAQPNSPRMITNGLRAGPGNRRRQRIVALSPSALSTAPQDLVGKLR